MKNSVASVGYSRNAQRLDKSSCWDVLGKELAYSLMYSE